ncbi:MAG: aminoglycoside phosphotransferase family protein [Solirubrobacteraceae bacterium]
MRVPDGLRWWSAQDGGAEWLAALPSLAAECAEQWELRLGDPFEPATISLVVPAEQSDGTPAVLKITFPQAESEHEPAALAHWKGDGAARLLEADAGRAALLVERLDPARMLRHLPDEVVANSIAADVLRRLWSVPPAPGAPFIRLEEAVKTWAAAAARRPPTQPRLVDLAAGFARELLPSPGEPAVLHQDFHGGNVLFDERRGWLAIDPKPLVGERAFDCAALVRDRRTELMRDPAPLNRIRGRLDQLADELELDRERIRGWAVVHAVAWGGETGPGWDPAMVACAGWLAEA